MTDQEAVLQFTATYAGQESVVEVDLSGLTYEEAPAANQNEEADPVG